MFVCPCILLSCMHCASLPSAIIASTCCSEVSHFNTSHTHLLIDWPLPRWQAATAAFTFSLRLWSVPWIFQCIFYLWLCLCDLIASKSLVSFKLSKFPVWVLCASTCLAHVNICALITELESTTGESSLMISSHHAIIIQSIYKLLL